MEPVPVPIATAPEGPLAEGEWFLRVEEPVRRCTTPRTSVPASSGQSPVPTSTGRESEPAPSVTDPPSDEDAPPRRTTRATAGRHPNRYHLPQPVGNFKECFSLYARQRDGRIQASDLMLVMRCLGSSPTPNEVQRHLLFHNTERGGDLDFSTFLSIMHRQLQQEAPEAEVLEALQMADKEQKGYILVSELRSKLTCGGERLTDQEVDDLLKEAGVGTDGKVYCEHFSKAVARFCSKP
uniref:EF-hand domain-containing protein n=1 Tax=Knipowitschia caucasica TaxID=637954 RepID=A0AAV2L1F8_KNICA